MNGLIGDSPWARQIRSLIDQMSGWRSSVLIIGPSGTGKELIATAIHQRSRRAKAPLVAVDCTSIPAGLFSSQLFGHVKGAFSGAECDTLGSFRAADGGTVFLDEIGELSLDLQAQLLRVIQQRTVIPVGSHKGIPVDVRIIAATSRRLAAEVDAGRFRLDLYYRLNVVRLETTPLRNRPEDVEPVCRHFLNKLSIENGLPRKRLSASAIRVLSAFDWPGNVRQLQNVLERVVVFSETEEITDRQILPLLDGEGVSPESARNPTIRPLPESRAESIRQGEPRPSVADREVDSWPTLAECECRLIEETLERTFYNQSAAARLLNVDRRLLARKIRKYGISIPGYYCHVRSA